MPQADDTTTVNEEAVDTSTNEETQDTDVDTDLEDMELSFDDVEDDETDETDDTDETESTEDTEPAQSEEESKDDDGSEDTDDESKEESEKSTDQDEESTEEDTASKEEQRKHNQEMAARRIAEKQAREAAKLEQQQKYLEQAEDAKDLALRQLQIDAFNNRVERNRDKLDSGIEKAVASIDLFRTGSPEVKEELARRLEDFEAKYVQYDQNGEPVNVTGDVYEYLTKEADSIRRILKTGARQQVKAKSDQKSRTQPIPTRAPKEPKVDPDLAAFDEEIARLSQSQDKE